MTERNALIFTDRKMKTQNRIDGSVQLEKLGSAYHLYCAYIQARALYDWKLQLAMQIFVSFFLSRFMMLGSEGALGYTATVWLRLQVI